MDKCGDYPYRLISAPNPILSRPIYIHMDRWTDCLVYNRTGEEYPTEVKAMSLSEVEEVGPKHGWNDFDWSIYYKNVDYPNCKISKLLIRGDERIQGILAYEPKEGYVEIHLAESAPHNVIYKEFSGVGPHLFAIACKESFDIGEDGYVTFTAKTDLIPHYEETLGAVVLDRRRRQMVIETEAARDLVANYFKE
ncbi:hypothetical protein [Salimicrobium flavidum]|uniref:Uncharacterized protein n=1 Tax=Salimicrobium flavidum TaxID=570947 RepID=A0A1N7KMQ8_9BACI|nr:hypothetical protein [Salimicrobium flavidum]SIS62740.1 hypothetical protein SAMN05421687_1149 [Salimicrobium flavidum]